MVGKPTDFSKSAIRPEPSKFQDRKYHFQIENDDLENMDIQIDDIAPIYCCCEGEFPAGFCLISFVQLAEINSFFILIPIVQTGGLIPLLISILILSAGTFLSVYGSCLIWNNDCCN
jgi:hypothetical protein